MLRPSFYVVEVYRRPPTGEVELMGSGERCVVKMTVPLETIRDRQALAEAHAYLRSQVARKEAELR